VGISTRAPDRLIQWVTKEQDNDKGGKRMDKLNDLELLVRYQDLDDREAGREIARRIKSGSWKLGVK
jgi:hypothetical protein